jgi:hypothetical protein
MGFGQRRYGEHAFKVGNMRRSARLKANADIPVVRAGSRDAWAPMARC